MTYRPFAAIIAAASSSSTGIKFELQNDSGSDISALQPVASDVNGKAKAINPSIEADAVKVAGIAGSAILDGSYGYVHSHGKIENVTTSYTFGDYIYVSKTGGLTNILPSEGVDGFVAGDFIIRVGIIVRNRAIPSQKDLMINIGIIGQI
jgi:hypothetical protein